LHLSKDPNQQLMVGHVLLNQDKLCCGFAGLLTRIRRRTGVISGPAEVGCAVRDLGAELQLSFAHERKVTWEGRMRRLQIGFLILAVLPCWAVADDVVRVAISDSFLRPGELTEYDHAVLNEVLERTRPDYGGYEVRPFTERVSLARAVQLAIEGRLVNLLALGVGEPLPEREMIPVPFPVDKGLLGYRVALVDRHSQDRLSRVDNVEELRQLRVGQGSGWVDVRIYEHQRIPIETTADYESLVLMLLHGRFDLFPRGLYEITPELAVHGKRYPDLAVEQHLLLHYPFFEAFYVSRSAPRLATRLTAGLERMVADGSFDALFAQHFRKLLADLHLRQRVVIELENPYLPAWVPLKRKELWFDPARLP